MIRALIVDDSLTVREVVSERLRSAGINVVGTAADGQEGVAMTHRLRPDVILMDVVMPGMDGLAATRQIMEEVPTPVVIFSDYANQEEVFKTYSALAAGALEVCAKPKEGGPENEVQWNSILLSTFAAAQVKVTRLRASLGQSRTAPSEYQISRSAMSAKRKVVVIGGSTGGLAAVRKILGDFPSDFPGVIIVALHCSRRFSSSFAQWFDRECALNFRDAENRDPLPTESGVVITVPPGYSMWIQGGCTILEEPTERDYYCPSIDRLFMSVAECYGDAAIGVLLTGMGEDGAQGLKRIHDNGGTTIAQDESTSVVYGMPAAAVRLNAVDHIAPVQKIAELLLAMTVSPEASHSCKETRT